MSGIPGYNGENGFYTMPNGAQAGLPVNMTQQMLQTNSTLTVINEFKFLAAKSVRQSTIILAAFNGVAGFIVVIGILVHCYMAAARRREALDPKIAVLNCVRGPELYPFVLSIGIMVQAIMFGVAQGQGLNGVYLAARCPELSGVVWLAWFIVPYIQMVLGVEAAGRSLRSSNFRPKGRFAALKCGLLILVMTIGTGSVAIIVPAQPICFASLPWFIARWAVGAFVILTTATVVLAVSAIILFRQLSTHLLIENDQRIEGSRLVYFLALGAVSNALMIPFFFNIVFGSSAQMEPGNTLAMIVMVVANLSGVLNGALYLFLRRGSLATISPRGHRFVDLDDQIYKIQPRSPQQLDFNGHLKQPVPNVSNMKWLESSESVDSLKKGPAGFGGTAATYADANLRPDTTASMQNVQPPPMAMTGGTLAPTTYIVPQQEQKALPTIVHERNASDGSARHQSTAYSVFPSNRQESVQSFGGLLLPSTTYNPNQESALVSPTSPGAGYDFLQPPPKMKNHRRGSSLASSATVRIGLRISNVDDMRAIAVNRQTTESSAAGAGALLAAVAAMPAMPSMASSGNTSGIPFSPRQHDQDLDRYSTATDTNKALPLVPAISPTKTVSPRGVGFNLPRRGPSPMEETAIPAPLRVRDGSSELRGPGNAWI
ncbi:hypothetical protein Micbo1qcDRAFT_50182 [Microdochium bolleyi]|uniref:Uncharacterized protein n=1 Tax=Microdochium bolleyi TaxID=196109 RepID=A0A136J6A3_9PEZI|nr:hypothetical protein Micbo1qcDRAFT_50182 [Microdochium bolleyi]